MRDLVGRPTVQVPIQGLVNVTVTTTRTSSVSLPKPTVTMRRDDLYGRDRDRTLSSRTPEDCLT